MRRWLGYLVLTAALALPGATLAGSDYDMEIQHLLAFVANSGCTFIRNGERHDAVNAAGHLRMKYDRGGRYINSAEQFIDRLASASSWSGESYTVTCEGVTRPSSEWLSQALAEYRQRRASQSMPS